MPSSIQYKVISKYSSYYGRVGRVIEQARSPSPNAPVVLRITGPDGKTRNLQFYRSELELQNRRTTKPLA